MVAWVRHGVALVGGFIAGSRGISAVVAWRAWHDLAASDPSGADLYRTTALLDLAVVAVCVALAALVWWILRPRNGAPLP
ncbi:MAG TPA: hypothetical protein VFN08_17230 [Gemmatimonadales bacterium]|nr:hypothetical protein [Gemmatimonadales bacterium]